MLIVKMVLLSQPDNQMSSLAREASIFRLGLWELIF